MFAIKLHLLIYSTLLSWEGGRETWLRYFLKGIANNFKEIHIYYLKKCKDCLNLFLEDSGNDNHIFNELRNINNIKWHAVSASNYLDWIFRTVIIVLREIHDEDIILSVGSGTEGIAGFIITKLTGKKLIVWLRTTLKNELSGRKSKPFVILSSIIERFILNRSNLIIANGFDTKQYYHNFLKSEKSEKIVVIPNAISNQYLEEISNLPPPNFRKPIKIAHIGRFVKERGSDYFINIARSLEKDERFQFEVWGPSYGSESLVNLRNLAFKGHYLPKILPHILSNIDVAMFLMPSKSIHGGGVSHALLETMAAKRLIISWRNNIVTLNKLLDDENSVLCDEGNLNQIISSLDKIAENPSAFTSKCLMAAERAKLFTEDEHLRLFNEALKKLCIK